MSCEFRILGPFEVRRDGATLEPLAPRARALLAVLVIHAGRVVSVDRLFEELWPEGPPAAARSALHVHVANVRRSIGAAQVHTHAGGYRLRLELAEIDARTFEAGLADALRSESPDPAELRALLELWRGEALSEFPDVPCARVEAARLEDLRADAQEAMFAGELARARLGGSLGDLRDLAARHPHRERVQGLLMRALYAAGRQAEALEVFRRARERMVDELGIEPGAELRDLHTAILRQHPSLTVAARTRSSRASPAPVPASPIVGRARELEALHALLGDPAVRLITVAGPGGVGKTRLVLEVINGYRERDVDVAFVALSSVAAAEHVGSALARALGVQLLPSEPIASALRRHLSGAALVLVLDTFEHVVGAAPLVAELLTAAPRLTVLVTSREPLHLAAEHVLRISPLPCQRTGTGTAAALFTMLAAKRGIHLAAGDRDAVQALCERLDGLPLAIELAVARLGLLGPAELVERLADDFDALGPGPRDAAARHRTLTATIAWSYALLSPREQAAFAALSVFAGGATLDAIESVVRAPLSVLEGLVEKHLVIRRPEAQDGRVAMLDTIRAFARQRLDCSSEAAAVHRRHAECCLRLATAVSAEIERTHARSALAAFDRNLDDYRAAVSWTLERPEPELALPLAAALAYPCWSRYISDEAMGWLDAALALGGTPAARAAALEAIGFLLPHRPDGEARARAATAAEESIELRRSLGDQAGTADSMTSLAKVQLFSEQTDQAHETAREAERMARDCDNQRALRSALQVRILASNSLDEALMLGDELASQLRAAGNTWQLAELRGTMAYCAALPHDQPELAVRLALEGLSAAKETDDPWKIAGASGNAGLAALFAGQYNDATAHFIAEAQWFLHHSAWSADVLYEGLNGLAAVAAARRHDELAARLSGAADNVTDERHTQPIADRLESRFFTPARARLGHERWAAAYAEGRESTPQDVFRAARAELLAGADDTAVAGRSAA